MLLWNDLHPYNAVHVIRLGGEVDPGRVNDAVTRTLEWRGLTGLALNRKAGTYQCLGGPASTQLKLTNSSDPLHQELAGQIEQELNTPFPEAERFNPFRFFIVPGKDSFALGLTYFHALADGESIVSLLMDVAESYRGHDNSASANLDDRYPRCRDSLLLHHPRVLAKELFALPSIIRQTRRSVRPRYRDPRDFRNKLEMFSLGPPFLDGMTQAAEGLGVTLNDLFLAVLMRASALFAPERARDGRRKAISIGCIVNVRKDIGVDGRRAFGVFLGSFSVQHEAPEKITLTELARDISRQTLAIKRDRRYLGAALEMRFGLMTTPLFSLERRAKLYQKHYPLLGGLTNMDINRAWPGPLESRPDDYARAVSTGPITPLVASLTTVGRTVNVSLSYRATAFTEPDIERIKDCFLKALEFLVTKP